MLFFRNICIDTLHKGGNDNDDDDDDDDNNNNNNNNKYPTYTVSDTSGFLEKCAWGKTNSSVNKQSNISGYESQNIKGKKVEIHFGFGPQFSLYLI